MPLNHAVIWIDHSQAHVMHFDRDATESERIRAHSQHKLHTKSGVPGAGHTPADQKYLHEVAHAVADAQEILIVGPSGAKLALIKHMQKHDPAIAANVVGIESVDHPSDGQLLAYARHYFERADRMRGDPVVPHA